MFYKLRLIYYLDLFSDLSYLQFIPDNMADISREISQPDSQVVYHICDMEHFVCDIPWYITEMVYTICDIPELTGIYQSWLVYTTTQPSRCCRRLH